MGGGGVGTNWDVMNTNCNKQDKDKNNEDTLPLKQRN